MKNFLSKHFKIASFFAHLIDHSISLIGFLLVCESTKEAIGYWLILVGFVYLFFNNVFRASSLWGKTIHCWIETQLKKIEEEMNKRI